MNIFLPYSDYRTSVSCLDNRRLGKQRAEVKAVLGMMDRPKFETQPLVKMWRPHLWWLLEYGVASCDEWMIRGFEDNLVDFFLREQARMVRGEKPEWPESYHSSIRANLLRKDPIHYGKFGWKETPVQGYAWPARSV